MAAKGGGSVASCRREGSLSEKTGADGVLTTRRGRKEGELDQSIARNQVNGYGDFDMSLGSSRIALHKVKVVGACQVSWHSIHAASPSTSPAAATTAHSTHHPNSRTHPLPPDRYTSTEHLTFPRHNGWSWSFASRWRPRCPPHPHPPRPPSLQIRCHWPRCQHVVLRKLLCVPCICAMSDRSSS